jgi:hypothetical protein
LKHCCSGGGEGPDGFSVFRLRSFWQDLRIMLYFLFCMGSSL